MFQGIYWVNTSAVEIQGTIGRHLCSQSSMLMPIFRNGSADGHVPNRILLWNIEYMLKGIPYNNFPSPLLPPSSIEERRDVKLIPIFRGSRPGDMKQSPIISPNLRYDGPLLIFCLLSHVHVCGGVDYPKLSEGG